MTIPQERITGFIEHDYLRTSRQQVYVACEDLDFVWDVKEVSKFERLWSLGVGLDTIARVLDRDVDEVVLLVIDRARQERIKPRQIGASRKPKELLI